MNQISKSEVLLVAGGVTLVILMIQDIVRDAVQLKRLQQYVKEEVNENKAIKINIESFKTNQNKRQLRKQSNKAYVYCICITGGPQSGKSAAITNLKERLQDSEHNVLIIPGSDKFTLNQESESVGQLTYDDTLNLLIMKLRIMQQLIEYNKQLAAVSGITTIILCEGGMLDLLYDLPQIDDLKDDLADMFESISNMRDKYYDAVIHLVTNAEGLIAHFYKDDSKKQRDQNLIDEAIRKNKQIQKIWTGHQNHMVIDNEDSNFDKKMERTLQCVQKIAGYQVTQGKWSKYLLEKIQWSEEQDFVKYELTDIFILASKDRNEIETLRIRQTECGFIQYYHIIKKMSENKNNTGDVVKRYISAEENQQLMKRKDPLLKPLIRERVCFTYKNQTMQIDIFKDIELGILRIAEPQKASQQPKLPEWLIIYKNVDNDPNYESHNLAKKL